jgi:ATP-dependent RNA helicase RhlE
MLGGEAMRQVIVFARTKHRADVVSRNLERDGFAAAVIHGNKSQNARQRALNGFRDGSVRILVATDIAARGIDVPGISHVVNYDLPDEAESYVHRIGRTGRNGASGVAVTLCDPEETAKLRQVERIIRMRLPVAASYLDQPDPAPQPESRQPRETETRQPKKAAAPARVNGGANRHQPPRPARAGDGAGNDNAAPKRSRGRRRRFGRGQARPQAA